MIQPWTGAIIVWIAPFLRQSMLPAVGVSTVTQAGSAPVVQPFPYLAGCVTRPTAKCPRLQN